MIVDASVVIDAVSSAGARGDAARRALAEVPLGEGLVAPGLLAAELLSGLRSVVHQPASPLARADVPSALAEAADYGITIEATPWSDVQRAYELSLGSLRYTDALYVAAAERHGAALLTADTRIARSGADVRCSVVTVAAG